MVWLHSHAGFYILHRQCGRAGHDIGELTIVPNYDCPRSIGGAPGPIFISSQ